MKFKLITEKQPKGDQPQAIDKLVDGYGKYDQQTLLGVTGSGKTFTMANVIEKLNKPTLIISHNKTLAAQLYEEFKGFFPENKVGYFISYYDYYQPESYLPVTDTFIEKETQINEKIEEYRIEAASALATRSDVIVVASVSCIYGLGSPIEFKKRALEIRKGTTVVKKQILRDLAGMGYERTDVDLRAGKFRSKGDTIEFVQGFGQYIYRIELFGDEVDKITERELVTNKELRKLEAVTIFPATPFVVSDESRIDALTTIREELKGRLPQLEPLLAHRLKQRTNYDLELIKELGFCKGIENYSRHFDKREPGTPPKTLIDFFPDEFLLMIDESHVTIPQIGGMYKGDKARKDNLIEYGFRLPSAADNRPLKFDEFEKYMKHVVHVSATPGDYEKNHSKQVVEQIIRPTYLVDPEIEIHKSEGQIEHLIGEVEKVIEKGSRVLITTLTKKMAEDLTDYLIGEGIKVRYLHSEIDTLERSEIIRDLRLGKFDVLVGINLLREGLDIPEVELVAILDADKEGFLRNTRSLIQTMGRAARNINGRVILYADEMTKSLKAAIKESTRRREKQMAYNEEHGTKPTQIKKEISKGLSAMSAGMLADQDPELAKIVEKATKEKDISKVIARLESEMKQAAEELDFETAMKLRDMIEEMQS